MLTKVGISEPEKRMWQYPHELSGGMRQRVMIAIALCCKPDLLIADEPTTALDVTVQAQIMDLIQQLKEEENMGVILITHDMAVVAENCDRVIVMYLGQMVEEASVTDIFEHPLHPYTIGLDPVYSTDDNRLRAGTVHDKRKSSTSDTDQKGLPFCVKMSVCDRQMQGRRTGIAENR